MTTKTTDEERKKCIATMGSELGELYDDLATELTVLYNTWNEFKVLYAGERETIHILNDWGPAFFAHVQDMMWREVILHLCRMTDPKKVAGKKTMSVQRLPELVADTDLQATVEPLVEDAVGAAKFARPFRNKRLAHRDLPPKDRKQAEKLTMGSREQVEDALKVLGGLLNTISLNFMQSTVSYESTLAAPGGASYLVHRLRDTKEGGRSAANNTRSVV